MIPNVAVITDTPDPDDLTQPFTGAPGRLLRSTLSTFRIDLDDWFTANDQVMEQLDLTRPLWVLALGSTTLSMFHPTAKLSAVHGLPFAVGVHDGQIVKYRDGDWPLLVMATFHPRDALRSDARRKQMTADLGEFIRLVNGGDWDLSCRVCNTEWDDARSGWDDFGAGLCFDHIPKPVQMEMSFTASA